MIKEESGKLKNRESLSDTENLTNLSSVGDWTILDEKLEEEVKIEKYDPFSKEQICCVELTNNNKIYICYEKEWTIKDV